MKRTTTLLAAAFAAMLATSVGAQTDETAAPEAAVEPAVEAVAAAEEAAEVPDLSDAEAAREYIDGYADNVQEDPDFKENIQTALATVRQERPAYGTFWAVFPPILAIVLALVTKEVYSSLFLGSLGGGLIWSGFAFEGTIVHVFSDG